MAKTAGYDVEGFVNEAHTELLRVMVFTTTTVGNHLLVAVVVFGTLKSKTAVCADDVHFLKAHEGTPSDVLCHTRFHQGTTFVFSFCSKLALLLKSRNQQLSIPFMCIVKQTDEGHL